MAECNLKKYMRNIAIGDFEHMFPISQAKTRVLMHPVDHCIMTFLTYWSVCFHSLFAPCIPALYELKVLITSFYVSWRNI